MDPFTEKLLERTRARRENLQKKMAERPTAVNRQMVKRTREPLVETNSGLSDPVIDKGPHPTSKPSPSKRRCSEENAQAAAGEENQEPAPTHSVVPILHDPPTDRKPPIGPTSVCSASSIDKTIVQSVVQSRPEQIEIFKSQPERMTGSVAPDPPKSSGTEVVPTGPALQKKREESEEVPTPAATGMKNRLQRLAQQRQHWDNQDIADEDLNSALPSPIKSHMDVPPPSVPTLSSETPLGRKGRLANLAATISSWEDDLNHPNIHNDNVQKQPVTTRAPNTASKVVADVPKPHGVDQVVGSQTASSKSVSSFNKPSIYSPVKSSKVILPSPQKTDMPVTKPEVQTARELYSTTSPQKSSEGTVYPSSPHKAASSSVPPMSQSPLRNKALFSSPKKSDLPANPTMSGPTVQKNKDNFDTKDHSTPLQPKATPGAPAGVKSFLERFGEKCQERSNQAKTPSGTPSVSPNTRLVQERLGAAHTANTTTADLTQKQKMERESELAAIRNRLQRGKNMWKNEDEGVEKKIDINQEPVEKHVECEIAKPQLHDDAPSLSVETSNTATNSSSAGSCQVGNGLAVSSPISTSSPLRRIKCSEKPSDRTPAEEVPVQEVEMNVDQSINSAVISELFDGVLEQSDDQSEEEDALNISSMSLLTPLAETVAAVVKSPERRMMTSTPTNTLIEKSKTPDNIAKSSKFQRVCMIQAGSSDSVEASDDDTKLLYSIDAYRSTRVKETERSSVKQVIVRKEDVSHKGMESRGSSLINIKQKIKMLSNEMNLQQNVIHQASQALNCCTDEEHGKGSQVEAEAERLLLVATERRAALKAALDCLKGEGPAGHKKNLVNTCKAEQDLGISASRGSISLQELRLPLKADFVCSTANKPESANHYFFLMIRSGAENTVATPLASTRSALSGDALTFTTKFTMSDVSSSFAIDIEVYYLVQKREPLNDKRKKPSKSKAITPKRFLAITKSSQTPVMASPGGPNAVRTSNFILVGSHKLTLSSLGKNKFSLEKVPFLCPLEGHIYLKMQCEVGSKVEERGFLTMFEDVSGFGAWHRRWCVLSGYCISYWTYPDDEKRKNPIGRINLANCTSKRVEPANREFCARPNTFELITVRPQREDDRETLVSQCNNTMCVTKNWLSADTKEERNLWMQKLNQILVDLRIWQSNSCYRSV